MDRKPFAAFGRVLYANYYSPGDVVEVSTSSTSKTVLFFSEGDFTARDKSTGETVLQCDPGWFSYGNHQDRLMLCTAKAPTVCWCYDPLVNQGYVPPISVFKLPGGQSTTLPVGTNLFLCRGTVTVNGKQFTGPYQVAVRSQDATLAASGDVYGLLFK